jgi:hypothetical protein
MRVGAVVCQSDVRVLLEVRAVEAVGGGSVVKVLGILILGCSISYHTLASTEGVSYKSASEEALPR